MLDEDDAIYEPTEDVCDDNAPEVDFPGTLDPDDGLIEEGGEDVES